MRKWYKDKFEVLNMPAFAPPQCGIYLLDISLRTAEHLFTAALRPEWVIATARVLEQSKIPWKGPPTAYNLVV